MVAFLNWAKSIALGTLNAVAKVAFFVVLLIIVLMVIGLLRGDGLPDKMPLDEGIKSALPAQSIR